MSMLTWSERLSVGVAEVDRQHMKLIDMLNELHTAVADKRADQVVESILIRLVGYTREHFLYEEQEMARMHYPALAEHEREHALLLQRVVQLQTELGEQKVVVSTRLLAFLKDWLTVHILQSDRDLGNFMCPR